MKRVGKWSKNTVIEKSVGHFYFIFRLRFYNYPEPSASYTLSLKVLFAIIVLETFLCYLVLYNP